MAKAGCTALAAVALGQGAAPAAVAAHLQTTAWQTVQSFRQPL